MAHPAPPKRVTTADPCTPPGAFPFAAADLRGYSKKEFHREPPGVGRQVRLFR